MHWIVLIIPNLFVLVTYSEFKKKKQKKFINRYTDNPDTSKKIKIPSEELKNVYIY